MEKIYCPFCGTGYESDSLLGDPCPKCGPSLPIRVKDAIRAADEAFWSAIAEAFPEATTGDVAPEVQMAWDNAVEIAVRQWVGANVVRGEPLDEEESESNESPCS